MIERILDMWIYVSLEYQHDSVRFGFGKMLKGKVRMYVCAVCTYTAGPARR